MRGASLHVGALESLSAGWATEGQIVLLLEDLVTACPGEESGVWMSGAPLWYDLVLSSQDLHRHFLQLLTFVVSVFLRTSSDGTGFYGTCLPQAYSVVAQISI